MGWVGLRPQSAPASIEDQRARLPPTQVRGGCSDEVSGRWIAHVYYAQLRDWYRYELLLTQRGDVLSGSIRLRGWTGTPSESEPPACRPGLRDAEWSEPAEGLVIRGPDGLSVRVDATSVRIEATHCGSASGTFALDHFAGRIDPTTQEFVSTNTYTFGAQTLTDLTVFRRVACADGASPSPPIAPTVTVPQAHEDPSPRPSRRAFRCGRAEAP
ncbi:MAG: hypothetical protein Q8Q09_18095 [Deltaproteobacteria bacterium]|nr:hypothetical protein [Deltaproteobacteria bacterium]